MSQIGVAVAGTGFIGPVHVGVLAEKGGPLRALSDIGTHWIDLACSVTGLEIEAVIADAYLRTFIPQRN